MPKRFSPIITGKDAQLSGKGSSQTPNPKFRRPRLTEVRREFQFEMAGLAPKAIAILKESLDSKDPDIRQWAATEVLNRSIPHMREVILDESTDADPAPELTAREAQILLQVLQAGTDGVDAAQAGL